ncbi:nuclear transport factor 2 family protein [Nocardia rhamnosiphila]|uniref:nuclear transport factor 2 family protein n=1 Tax=Nocardia rhamnosiphila TaxID=426716 RepID=UPI0033F8E5C7
MPSRTPSPLGEAARTSLGTFETTQHIITNHEMPNIDGRNSPSAHLLATHAYPTDTGRPSWSVGGRYEVDLHRTGEFWKFETVALIPLWQAGDAPELG